MPSAPGIGIVTTVTTGQIQSMYRLRLGPSGGVHLSVRSRSSGRVPYDCRSSLRQSASPSKYPPQLLPSYTLAIITIHNPRPKPSHRVKIKNRNNSQTHDGDCDRNGRGPEKPLLCIHITYIVGIHAERRGGERKREENDGYGCENENGGFLSYTKSLLLGPFVMLATVILARKPCQQPSQIVQAWDQPNRAQFSLFMR